MTLSAAMIRSESEKIVLIISKLSGRAKNWALTCNASLDAKFPTWDSLKRQMSRAFELPYQAYRWRSHFLASL